MTILESIDDYIQDLSNLDVQFDSELFQRALDLIVGLEPEQLTDDQLEEVIFILDDIETEEDLTELRLSKRSSPEKKREARKYWRTNKVKIKVRRKKFKRSAEGRKRKRMKKRLLSVNKTPTGRRKVRYHV